MHCPLKIRQVILSYLMQTAIAMLSLGVIATYQFIKLRRSKKHPPPPTPYRNTPYTNPQSEAFSHLHNFHRFLSDFHKLQCYYSITLQIAALIALYGPPSTTNSIRNPFDEAFLLLVSTNGIIPIAVMFYTLGLCDIVTLYHIPLTSLSAILGSITGIEIVRLLSKPYERTSLSDSEWPAATAGLAPEGICGRKYEITYPEKLKPGKVFLVGTVLCDSVILGIIASYWLATRNGHLTFPGRSFPLSERTTRLMNIMIHVVTASTLVYCTALECFFFYQMLVPQYDRIVNFQDWGFGQIVGMTVWAVVIVDFVRHEIGLAMRRS